MKLALIYDKNDHKLIESSYSQTYKHMLDALVQKFENVTHIHDSCHAKDIDADVIIFYDIHSSHHIEIEGLRDHSAIKYSYYNDPHQLSMKGVYKDGTPVNKLGAKSRVARSLSRGINFIICPYTDGFNQFIAPHLGSDAESMFLWFPVAPRKQSITIRPLIERRQTVVANGHLWHGREDFKPYEFRNWAYRRPNIEYIPHYLSAPHVYHGNSFMYMLSKWAGALALTDLYVVPKYLEIPLAGCLCVAQKREDYVRMGFKDNEHCIYVDYSNFDAVVDSFMRNIVEYQFIADNGRKLVENNYTAKHFAEFVYKHCKTKLGI